VKSLAVVSMAVHLVVEVVGVVEEVSNVKVLV
jgi:hypothetical protein